MKFPEFWLKMTKIKKFFRKVVETMAVIYVALIIKGKRTYASVPAILKPQVKEMLHDLELDELIKEE